MPKKSDLIKKTMEKITEKDKFLEFYRAIKEEEEQKETDRKQKIKEKDNIHALQSLLTDPLDIMEYFKDDMWRNEEDLLELGFGDGDVQELSSLISKFHSKASVIIEAVYNHVQLEKK